MIIKKQDPVEALKAAFQERVEDTELQRNYDNFKHNLGYAKERYNELVPQVNENLTTLRTLNNLILKLAIEGTLSPEASARVKELERVNKDLTERIEEYRVEIEYYESLMEKYEKASESKLYIWWDVFSTIDPDTKPWLEWKKTYQNKII